MDRIAELEAQLDAERQRTRTATQLIIETVGATGPEDLESALGRLVAQLDAEREKVGRLKDWRDQVTLALKREGGTRFEDVPGHVRAVAEELATLKGTLLHAYSYLNDHRHGKAKAIMFDALQLYKGRDAALTPAAGGAAVKAVTAGKGLYQGKGEAL